MSTTVTIETDKGLPPIGSSRRRTLEDTILKVVQLALNDLRTTVILSKRS